MEISRKILIYFWVSLHKRCVVEKWDPWQNCQLWHLDEWIPSDVMFVTLKAEKEMKWTPTTGIQIAQFLTLQTSTRSPMASYIFMPNREGYHNRILWQHKVLRSSKTEISKLWLTSWSAKSKTVFKLKRRLQKLKRSSSDGPNNSIAMM